MTRRSARWRSSSAILEEIGRSRIRGGIHFPSADEAGQVAGRAIGSLVVARLVAINLDRRAVLHGEIRDLHRVGLVDLISNPPKNRQPWTEVVLGAGPVRIADREASKADYRFYNGVVEP